jgi:hypothetical protein
LSSLRWDPSAPSLSALAIEHTDLATMGPTDFVVAAAAQVLAGQLRLPAGTTWSLQRTLRRKRGTGLRRGRLG